MSRTAIDRYLTLLKKTLLGEPYFDNEIRLIYLRHFSTVDTLELHVFLAQVSRVDLRDRLGGA